LHQAGDNTFINETLRFGYGENCTPLKENRIQGVQALSGTGGLRLMGDLLGEFSI
jgi:aspartate aminotransferase, mitochondrial